MTEEMAPPETPKWDETELNIINAAIKVFSEKGFKGATTRLIANEAGVNEVTIFRRFGSKDNLFEAVALQGTDLTDDLLQLPKHLEDLERDPVEKLTSLGLFILKNMQKRKRLLKLMVREGARFGFQRIAERAPKFAVSRLTKVFEDLGVPEPRISAIVYVSFLLRSVLFEAFLGSDVLLETGQLDEDQVRRFANIIVHGMYHQEGS